MNVSNLVILNMLHMVLFSISIVFFVISMILVLRKKNNWKIAFLIAIVSLGILAAVPKEQQQAKPAHPSPVQQAALERQQAAFAAWYRMFEEALDELDKPWQEYKKVIKDVEAGDLSPKKASEKLTPILQKAKQCDDQFKKFPIPPELAVEHQELMKRILKEVQGFSAARSITIEQTKEILDRNKTNPKPTEELVNDIKKVIVTTNKVYINIAQEVAQLTAELKPSKVE